MSVMPVQDPDNVVRGSLRRRAEHKSIRPRVLERVGRLIIARALAAVESGNIVIHEHGAVTSRSPDATSPPIAVRVNNRRFFAAAGLGGGLGLAEAYLDGDWECDDLAGLIEVMASNLDATKSLDGVWARSLGVLARGAYWLERNTRAGSRRNIVAHYDLGNEFFGCFLDRTMSYSSAIFENGAESLEAAQIEKIDRACRVLELTPGDHVLEIGTGWGALAIHAARRYGCRVTTTTISDAQHEFAAARVREAGLSHRVTLLRKDYRDLAGRFEKIVSIEMIEAVGRENFGTYFGAISRLLRPEGAALIQSIVIRDQQFEAAARRRDFLKKYIFPGSCLPGVRAMLDATTQHSDLRLWDLKEIGPHYAKTLKLWRETFMSRRDHVRAMGFDDRFIRMWEYYLAYCEGAFRARCVGDVQMLLVKPKWRGGGSPPTNPRGDGA